MEFVGWLHQKPNQRSMKNPAALLSLLLYSCFMSFSQPQFSEQDLAPGSVTNLEAKFSLFELDKFEQEPSDETVFLKNGYAKSKILNPTDWSKLKEEFVATEINLVYTKYPVNKELWRTNYRGLMVDRLKALFEIDSSLNSANIEWNILLQTGCKNEPEAMKYEHGIEIVYQPIPRLDSARVDSITSDKPVIDKETALIKSQERKLTRLLKRYSENQDSTVEKIFERNTEWKEMLVVMDWTGSMYGFGAKAIRWHLQNFRTSGVKNVVLFTDGEPNRKKGKIGDYGGIYYSAASDPKKLIKVMRRSMFRNYNNKIEENNIEGLIKGIKTFPKFEEVVMIADNRSCMKDYCLCDLIDVPVRIVLCGTDEGINPQYVNLAYELKGSIHTLDSDINGFEAYKVEGTELTIDSSTFVYNAKYDRFEEKGNLNGKYLGYQDCEKFYRTNRRCRKFLAKNK